MVRNWRLFLLPNVCVALLTAGCATWQMPGKGKTASADLDRSFALARLTERKGNLDQAEQIYKSMQKRSGKDPALDHRLGVVAARQGRLQEARQHFEKALEAGGKSPELMADLGYCCYLMDDHPAAEKVLRQALERDPHNRRARNNLGLVIGEQGRFDESLAQFKLAGNEAEAHANLAYVHTQLGQLKAAAEEYNLALGLNQNLRPAANALVQLAKEEPAREKARQLALSRQRPAVPPQAPPTAAPPVERLANVQPPMRPAMEIRPAPPVVQMSPVAPPPPAMAVTVAAKPIAPPAPAQPAPPAPQRPALEAPAKVVTVAHAAPVRANDKPIVTQRIEAAIAPAPAPAQKAVARMVIRSEPVSKPKPADHPPAQPAAAKRATSATAAIIRPQGKPAETPSSEAAPPQELVSLPPVQRETVTKIKAVAVAEAPVETTPAPVATVALRRTPEAAPAAEATPEEDTVAPPAPVTLNDYRLDGNTRPEPLFSSRGLGRSRRR